MNKTLSLLACLGLAVVTAVAAPFRIQSGRDVTVSMPSDPAPVLKTALRMFSGDVSNVFDSEVKTVPSGASIAVSIDTALVSHPQGFRLEVNPSGTLRIIGGGCHGAAYGLLELSRLIGVSPWEWWADATPAKKAEFSLPDGFSDSQAPDVEFRGIFINDEDWGLTPWSYKHFEPNEIKGAVGPKTTAKIFELLLRLRANTYWPPMHECSHPFFLTPGNREVAEEYGIYIGTSHCEPLASNANGEWKVRGTGDYDYTKNADNVLRFWEDRVRETANQEMFYTLGMRGVHDSGMLGANTPEEQKAVLEKVLADQRSLIGKYVNPDVTKVPQVFIPYKEVLDAYNGGLQVPDDVTLMWCDDNYGYIRHFPSEKERARKGGNGIYYHVSYWGRPHDYLWLGTFSPSLLKQQMDEAYDRGIQKIWILNVGDIKPAEYQIELFMDMGWDIDKVREDGLDKHIHDFMSREFGKEVADEAAPAMTEAFRLAYIRKPEFMGNTREEERQNPQSRVIKDLPWSKDEIAARLASYDALSDKVEALDSRIPADRRDAFFQLVKYPVQGAAQMNRKLLYAQRARHGEMDWQASDAAFDSIAALTRIYNQGLGNGGKFNGIMDFQPRRLPPFGRVPRTEAAEPAPSPQKPLLVVDGADGLLACPKCIAAGKPGHATEPLDGLGYNRKAVAIPENNRLTFELPEIDAKEAVVEVRLLPVHPVHDDGNLAFSVSIDGSEPQSVNYATAGRSEEWKQNVLRNQAIRRITLPLAKARTHSLVVMALTPGVVLDQVAVYPVIAD